MRDSVEPTATPCGVTYDLELVESVCATPCT